MLIMPASKAQYISRYWLGLSTGVWVPTYAGSTFPYLLNLTVTGALSQNMHKYPWCPQIMNNEFEDSDTVPPFTFLEIAKYHSSSKLKALTPPNPNHNLHPDPDPDSKDAWELGTAWKSKRMITSKLVRFCSCFISRNLQSTALILAALSLLFLTLSLTPAKRDKRLRFPTRNFSTPRPVTLYIFPDPNPNFNLSKHGNWIKTSSLFTGYVHLSESCRRPQLLLHCRPRFSRPEPCSWPSTGTGSLKHRRESWQQTKCWVSSQHAQSSADYGKHFIKSLHEGILNNLVAFTL